MFKQYQKKLFGFLEVDWSKSWTKYEISYFVTAYKGKLFNRSKAEVFCFLQLRSVNSIIGAKVKLSTICKWKLLSFSKRAQQSVSFWSDFMRIVFKGCFLMTTSCCWFAPVFHSLYKDLIENSRPRRSKMLKVADKNMTTVGQPQKTSPAQRFR